MREVKITCDACGNEIKLRWCENLWGSGDQKMRFDSALYASYQGALA